MRKYEVMFIVRPDLPEDEVSKLITQMETVVAGAGGKVEKVDKMGRRRLAYRVKKNREGNYVLFTLEGSGETVKELERRFKVADAVIKFMTVRIDEEQKRAEKRRALRAKEDAKGRRSKTAGAPPVREPTAPPASEPAAGAAQA